MDIKNFEIAYLNAGGKASELEKEDGEYVSSKAQMGWEMWQASAQVVPEGFEQAYSEIFSPIVKRPYPRLENGDYKYIEINQGWKLWQAATAQAVPEWFVLVPKELSDEKADIQASLVWGCHLGLFKSQNRDMSTTEIEEFRLKWCRNKARDLQEQYKAMIEAQEQSHE